MLDLMNSMRSLKKTSRYYFHGKYESCLIIQQGGLCLQLQGSASKFKGLLPELPNLTFQ